MFKIMTFNVRIDVEVDQLNQWKFRKEKLASYIQEVHPVILGIQEANQQMMKDLMGLLSEYEYIGLPREKGNEHSAILYDKSQVKLLREKTFWLSETPNVQSKFSDSNFLRIATYGQFFIQGKKYSIINTHLDYRSEEIALNQMKVLLNETLELPFPKVIMGDFNVNPQSLVNKFLQANGWILPYDESMLSKSTFHNYKGTSIGSPIDYIYVSKNLNVSDIYIDQNTCLPIYLSDHFPVIALIE